jgi:hypothetical protein
MERLTTLHGQIVSNPQKSNWIGSLEGIFEIHS